MDFQLNEEQQHLKKRVREFAEREIAPNVMKWDEDSHFPMETVKETRQAWADGHRSFPLSTVARAWATWST